ncbi:MAG: circularly permuted type 2 ATP-grasp protein [Immundisolibacter sp.]|uniref:circularly permuted type 2 ATP-grasp protein n=1 Tax=Immundisolibacter sp. TaxID=1934948 RepID=UPI003EE3C2C9
MHSQHSDATGAYSSWDGLSLDDDRHPHWQRLTRALRELGPAALTGRAQEARRLLHETGVTYNVYGAANGVRQPWPLDVVPLLVGSEDWAVIEAGLVQRAELLNLILTDLYGPRDILRRGLLPPALVFGHGGFLRACQDIRLPAAHQLPLYAADLVRDGAGQTWVMADRTQAPSGIGYALENRRVTARVLPSLYRDAQVHRQEPFLRALRGNLVASAPPAARDDPVLALLTPGVRNETYYEQALLAEQLGLELVEGSDLVMRGGRLYLRALGGLTPIDVLWRRVDDAWCDPLELRADSFLGVPGLVEAARRRQVSVVNPLGSGVLENPALGAYLPSLARHFLGEDLRLPSVESYWCGDPQQLDHVLAHLPQLVIKRLQRRPDERSVFGANLKPKELAVWRERLLARPAQFAAQAAVAPIPTPSFGGRSLSMRPVLLRAFLTAGSDGYRVLPGGFARVAPQADTLFISNQAGAMGKDVWVLASEPETEAVYVPATPPTGAAHGGLPRRAAENLFWVGRYLERAGASLRLLRLTLGQLADNDATPDPGAGDRLHLLMQTLTRMTANHPDLVHLETDGTALPGLLTTLLTDRSHAGSVAFDLQALAQAAEAVRERLPEDALHLLADLPTPLASPRADLATPEYTTQVTQQLMHGLLAVSGALNASTEQDAGWHFLELGRCIERGQSLSVALLGLLCITAPQLPAPPFVEAALGFCDCLPAYRRYRQNQPQLRVALELLLLDPRQPRGMMCQVQGIEQHLAALPRAVDNAQLDASGRFALDAASRLRLLDLADLDITAGLDRSALDQFLGRGEYLLRELSDAIAIAHFQPPLVPHSLLQVPAEPS